MRIFDVSWRVIALSSLVWLAGGREAAAQPIEIVTDIHSLNGGLCLGINGSPLVDGAAAMQSSCQNGAFQSWFLRPLSGQSQIIVKSSNQCLAIAGASKTQGAAVVQTSCAGTTAGTWYVKPSGSGFQIVNYNSGMCLSVSQRSTLSGAPMVQWACGPSTNLWQAWGFSSAAQPMSVLSQASGKCLDSAGIVQNSCSGASTQQWNLVPYQNGFRLIVPSNGFCLGIDPNHAGSGLAFTQAACKSDGSNTDWGQRWYMYNVGSAFELGNGISPWCMEVDSQSDGAVPVQKACNSSQNQLWAVRTRGSLSPDIAGQWGPVISLPIVPAAVAGLPNGKVVMWAANDPMDQSGSNLNSTYTALFDPATDTSTEKFIIATNHNMFCPGTANLPDGRVFVSGGASNYNTTIYDSVTDTWTADKLMNIGRGYQGDTVMPTGNVFTIGGSWPASNGGKTGEMWNASTGWTLLPGLPDAPVTGPDPQGPLTGDNHLWLFATGSNAVFHAGPTSEMHWLETSGSGSYSNAGLRGDDQFSIAGVAVMIGPGLILKAGGSTSYGGAAATNSTYMIDFNNGVVVTKRQPMLYPRIFASGVVLPTGDVLVSGGQTYGAQFTDTNPIFAPELWSWKSSTFAEQAPMIVPRTYHSVALLLPDARVLVGGGGLCLGPCSVNHPDLQIFTPPYLLNADGSLKPRVRIVSAPAGANHGAVITVGTSGAAASFAMIRISSITHTVNNDQRRVSLTGTLTGANRYSLTIPGGTASVLASYYMLFAMDSQGVPSVASILQILP